MLWGCVWAVGKVCLYIFIKNLAGVFAELDPQFKMCYKHFGINNCLHFSCCEEPAVQRASMLCAWAACVTYMPSDSAWIKGHDIWLWAFLFNLFVKLVREIKLTVGKGYLLTGGDQCSLEVRGDRSVLGMSMHGNALWLRKFQLISLCVNLHEMPVKSERGFSNTSKDLVKLLVAIKLTGKAKCDGVACSFFISQVLEQLIT